VTYLYFGQSRLASGLAEGITSCVALARETCCGEGQPPASLCSSITSWARFLSDVVTTFAFSFAEDHLDSLVLGSAPDLDHVDLVGDGKSAFWMKVLRCQRTFRSFTRVAVAGCFGRLATSDDGNG
jgi:hypothetical protein